MTFSPTTAPQYASHAERGDQRALGTLLRDLIGAAQGDDATVAAAGSSASDATALTARYNAVTAADGTKGVALPACEAGLVVFVVNTVTTAALKVYPVSGGNDNINALAEDLAFTLGAGQSAWFIGTSAAQWYVAQADAAHGNREHQGRAAGGTPGTRHVPFRLKNAGTLIDVTLIIGDTAVGGSAGTSATTTWEVLKNGITMTAASGLTAAALTNAPGSRVTFTINKDVTAVTDVFELVHYTDTGAKPDIIWNYRPGAAV